MKRISFDEKLKICKENEEGYGRQYFSKKYNISSDTIRDWIFLYQNFGEDGLKRSMSKSKYSGEFKLSVLSYRKINNLSFRETAKYFKIRNASIVRNWQRRYDEEGFEGLNNSSLIPSEHGEIDMSKEKKKIEITESEKEELLRLREENMYLRASLAYEKKLQALIREKELKTGKNNHNTRIKARISRYPNKILARISKTTKKFIL